MNTKNVFPSKAKALAYLKENPLQCVYWDDGNMCAIYWNGRIRCQRADATRIWANFNTKN